MGSYVIRVLGELRKRRDGVVFFGVFLSSSDPTNSYKPKVEQYCRDSWWSVTLRNCHLKLFGSNFLRSSSLHPSLLIGDERKDLAFLCILFFRDQVV